MNMFKGIKILLSIFVVSMAISIVSFLLFITSDAYASPSGDDHSEYVQESVNKAASEFSFLAIPLRSKPSALYFTNSEQELSIESITLEEGGVLGVPANFENAGWYERSAKPGEIGNVVLAGHYDNSSGNPAAFWELKNLKVNDKVSILDEVGNEFNYLVTESFFVEINDPSRTDYLKHTDEAVLTLVTCGGVWNPVTQDYNMRLIVRAKQL